MLIATPVCHRRTHHENIREGAAGSRKGQKKPRFRVVAVAGEGLRLHAGHLRKMELEQIAKDVGADIVYLEPVPEDL